MPTQQEVEASVKQVLSDAVNKKLQYMWEGKPVTLTGRYVLRNRKGGDTFESMGDVQLQVEVVCVTDLPDRYDAADIDAASKAWVAFRVLGLIQDIKDE